jgi:hypothetical protein
LDDVLMLLADEMNEIGRLLKRETPRANAEDTNLFGSPRFQNEPRLPVGD